MDKDTYIKSLEARINSFDGYIAETEKLMAELRKDREYLNWLERFLQMGGAGIFSSPTCESHKTRPDDTPETDWNHPFSIGLSIEIEDDDYARYSRWQELSNGAKGIRPAIEAAIKKWEEVCPKN